HASTARTFLREAKIGACIEQIVLHVREQPIERRIRVVNARQPDCRIELVERAIGGDAQIVFFAPLAAAERRRAVVAGAGVDAVENDHRWVYPRVAQMTSMMTTMATNCSRTRSRMSFCDRWGEPPRIMFARPITSTTATAAIAIGTSAWVRNPDICRRS